MPLGGCGPRATLNVQLQNLDVLLDFEQMNDMRRWANQASMANNPTWALGQSEEQIPGGGDDSWGDQVPVGDHVDGNPTNEKPGQFR